MIKFEVQGVEYLFLYIFVKVICEIGWCLFVLVIEVGVLLMQVYCYELLEVYECCINYKRIGKDVEFIQVMKNLK